MSAEHASITVQRDMLGIVTMWPALLRRLGEKGGGDQSGVRVAPGSKPPTDLHVSDVIAEITSWAYSLARNLRDEVTVERDGKAEPWAPNIAAMPDVLDEIARWRVGHFTEHEDEFFALAVADDAKDYRAKVRNLLAPTGARKIDLRVACLDHGTNDQGERVVCAGQYWTMLVPGQELGEMICSDDEQHRLSVAAWQAAQRRGTLDPEAVRRIVAKIGASS